MAEYVFIDEKKMDKSLIDTAEEVVNGRGAGRISLEEAKVLMEKITEKGNFNEIQKDTTNYIRKSFNWTSPANNWFSFEINRWTDAKRH